MLLPKTKTFVMVRSNDRELVVMGQHENLFSHPKVHMARDVVEVISEIHFHTLISNLCHRSLEISDRMVIVNIFNVPDLIADLPSYKDDPIVGMTYIVNAISLYRKHDHRKMVMNQHLAVTEDEAANGKTVRHTPSSSNDEHDEF